MCIRDRFHTLHCRTVEQHHFDCDVNFLIIEGYKPSTTLCRDRENRIVSDPEKIKTIWREYFDGLLGGMIPVSYTHLDVYKRQILINSC